MRPILIVTYYWPPSGGSGVQRWLKFSKYLVRLGYEVTVLTPENPSFALRDDLLQQDVPPEVEVLKLPIWEPYRLYQMVASWFGVAAGQPADFVAANRKSFFSQVSAWVRGNAFIPDARIFWVRPAVQFLSSWLRPGRLPVLITTGPPHSIHLIGRRLKKKFPALPWVADFRDPWSEWDLLDELMLTDWARVLHRALERAVLCAATRVVTIAPFHQRRLEALSGRPVDLITNGFDADDFAALRRVRTTVFTIRHVGVVDHLRDPRPFMRALRAAALCAADFAQQTCVEFVGNVNTVFQQEVQADTVLAPITRFVPPVPHRELLQLYGATDVQLLVLAHTAIAPGNLPGKFFEYLASGNPILAVGPAHGDAHAILTETGAGCIFERTDEAGMQRTLLSYFEKWKSNSLVLNARDLPYTRKNLTEKLARLLDSMAEAQ
jgi:glycosyltransferase involved in cell wall biosynthesis